ncbi:MAG TPA: hypothetical protein VES42_09510, partial [Pilimelia sp.]|nr:hypothetical protein [Pilimelia sp.]
RAAALLRPAPPAPIRFAGTGMQLRVTVTGGRAAPARVVLRLQPEREDRVVEAVLAAGPGARTYAVPTPACRLRGCRLVDLVVHAPDRDFRGLTVTVSAIRQTGPAAAVVTLAQLADPKRWLVTGVPGPHTGRGGLRLAYTAGADLRASVLPAGTPRALPTLVTPVEPPAVPAREGRPRAAPVGQLRLVPRAGGTGALIDLEYAELAGLTSGMAREPQVWLAADAPAELPARLREQGLVVVADRSVDVAVARQERSGPALALAFYLFVAVAAVAVGVGGVAVVAATERSALAGQLGALRAQGLPAVATWRIAFGGHLTVTVLGAVVGCAAGALSWSVARGVVPMFADGAGAIYAPAWPRPVPVLAALGAALVVLVVAGAAAAVGLRRAVERGDG